MTSLNIAEHVLPTEYGEVRSSINNSAHDCCPVKHARSVCILVNRRSEIRWNVGLVRKAAAFNVRPAIVLAFLDNVYFFPPGLPHIAANELSGVGIEREPPRVTQPHGVVLSLYSCRIHSRAVKLCRAEKWIIHRYAVIPSRGWM